MRSAPSSRQNIPSLNYDEILRRTADVFCIDISKVTVEKYDNNKCIAMRVAGCVEAEAMLKCMEALRYQVFESKKEENLYFIPPKIMIEFQEAIFQTQTRNFLNHYLYIYTCFSYILPLHLKPEQFKISGASINIKVSFSQSQTLQPLLSSQAFLNIIEDYQGGYCLRFARLLEIPHEELRKVFALLAPNTGIHEWKVLPITVIVSRFTEMLKVTGMIAGLRINTQNPNDENEFVMMPIGDLRSDIFEAFLTSKGYVVYEKPNKYMAITRLDAIKFVRSCDKDSRIMAEFEQMVRVHQGFVEGIKATKLLQIEYRNKHALVSYKGQRTANNGVMLMFEAHTLTDFNAKDMLHRLTAMAKVKELCDANHGCISAVCEDSNLTLRTSATNLGSQMFKARDVSVTTEGSHSTQVLIRWDAVNMFSTLIGGTSLEKLQADINQVIAVYQVRMQLAAKLNLCLKKNKISYAYNESHITLTLDDHDAMFLMPLLRMMGVDDKAGAYKWSVSEVARLLQPECLNVFSEISVRYEMVALYRALSAVFGESFVSRMKTILAVEGTVEFNDTFFNLGVEKLKAVRVEIEAEAQKRKEAAVVVSAPRQVSSEPLSPKIKHKVVDRIPGNLDDELLPAIQKLNSGANKPVTKPKSKQAGKKPNSKLVAKPMLAKQPAVSAKDKSTKPALSKAKPVVAVPLPKPDSYKIDVSNLQVNDDQLTLSNAAPEKKKRGNAKKINKVIREASANLEESLPFVSSEQSEEGKLAVHYSTLFSLLKLMEAIHARHEVSDMCLQLTVNDADAGEIAEVLTLYLPSFACLLEFQRQLATEGHLQQVLTGVIANQKLISLRSGFSLFVNKPELDIVQSVTTTFTDLIKLGSYFNHHFKTFQAHADVKVATSNFLFACKQPVAAHEAQAIQGCINKLARLHPVMMKANLGDKFPVAAIAFMESCIAEKRVETLDGLRLLARQAQEAWQGSANSKSLHP